MEIDMDCDLGLTVSGIRFLGGGKRIVFGLTSGDLD